MSHGPRLDHRIACVDFSEGYIACSCRWERTVTESAGLHDGNAAVEAAWLAHRREAGEALRALLSSAGLTTAMAGSFGSADGRVNNGRSVGSLAALEAGRSMLKGPRLPVAGG